MSLFNFMSKLKAGALSKGGRGANARRQGRQGQSFNNSLSVSNEVSALNKEVDLAEGSEQGSSQYYKLTFFRITIIWMVIFASISLLVGRLMWIQIINPERLIKEGESRTIRHYVNEPARGLITDRNGKILALSVPSKSVVADAKILNDKKVTHNAELLRKIASILEIDPKELFDKISNEERRYVRLKQYLMLNKARELERLDVPGLTISDNYQRYYTTGPVNAHLVGFVNSEGNGVYGIEASFNEFLSSSPSKVKAKKDLEGHVIENLGVVKEGKVGGNLVLSVDDRLQTFAYEALEKTVNKFQAEYASAVMMDVKTGEVMAMVNFPSFDPNDRSVFNASLARNRTITDTFEPGSTIKPIIALGALESGMVTWNETFDTHPYVVNGKRITDSHKMDSGKLFDILEHSSNIGMAHIGQRIGQGPMVSMLERFGFGSNTNSGLAGEVNGNIYANRTFWSEIDKATFAYGYGLTVTSLQLASSYATLANYGAKVPVSILRTVETPKYQQVANITEIRRMHTALKGVVDRGSGRRAAITRYNIAGKTGTAHIARDGTYANEYVSSFVGFGPLSDPRFAVVIVVFRPQAVSYFGGAVTGMAFNEIMTKALQLYNIPPDKTEEELAKLE